VSSQTSTPDEQHDEGNGNGADGGGGGPGGDAASNSYENSYDGGTGSNGDDSGGSSSNDDGGGSSSDAGEKDGSSSSSHDGSTSADAAPSDGFDAFQHHNLDVINQYRAGGGVAPLVLDQQLCTFALAGSQELSQDHMPHQHFIKAGKNGTLWTSGFKSNAGENQGDPNGWPKAPEMMQIDQIQAAMYAEGPGAGPAHGHYMNMMNPDFKRLGVGLLEVQGKLYLTNDFSN
jgi:hypothetical protein